MIGERIANYEILAKLGEGAMGTVWQARDVDLERLVAVKVMNAGLEQHPDLEARFRYEARTQANLSHQNVARLYQLLKWEGKAVMVMEFVDGTTLQKLIEGGGPIGPETAAALCRQALQGVGAAHRQGVVHRDLKPANLMLNSEGVVKVMDFGIAKIKGGSGLTRTAMQMGTYYYMSPEQVLGKDVDFRTDIYAMGITLYEMLTGDVPFNYDSEYEIQTAHVQRLPDNPMARNGAIPPALAGVVMKALEKDPAARFQTTEEFIAALPRAGRAAEPEKQVEKVRGTVMEPAAPAPVSRVAPPPPGAPPPPPPAPPVVAKQPVVRQPVAPAAAPVVTPYVAPRAVMDVPAAKKNPAVMIGGIAAAVLVVGGLLYGGWQYAREQPAKTPDPAEHANSTPPPTSNPNGGNTPQSAPTPPSGPRTANSGLGASGPGASGPGAKADPRLAAAKANSSLGVTPEEIAKLRKLEAQGSMPADRPERTPSPDPGDMVPVKVPAAAPAASANPTWFQGNWMGTYKDTGTQQTTPVNFTLHGAEQNKVAGTMTFATAENPSGSCSVSSQAFDPAKGQLVLLMTKCSGPSPAFLHMPTTFANANPNGVALTQGRVYSQSGLTVVLTKMSR